MRMAREQELHRGGPTAGSSQTRRRLVAELFHHDHHHRAAGRPPRQIDPVIAVSTKTRSTVVVQTLPRVGRWRPISWWATAAGLAVAATTGWMLSQANRIGSGMSGRRPDRSGPDRGWV